MRNEPDLSILPRAVLVPPPRAPRRPPGRLALAFALAFVVLAPLALAVTPVQAGGDLVAPGAGARNYFAPRPAGAGAEEMNDRLQRALFDAVTAAARARGQVPPASDVRLEAFAATLARTLAPDEVPGVEMQEFLLAHFGLGDPIPELAMLQVWLDDDQIRERMTHSLPRFLAGGPYGRVGVGVNRRWSRTSVVIAFQRVDVELLPVPRRLDSGASALVGGRLLGGLHRPTVLVAPPAGEVRELPLRGSGASFQTSLRCDAGDGRYQVEIFGVGAGGKTVVANFPVFCGVPPPRSLRRSSGGEREPVDPRQAEALLLEAVNRDRAAAGLPALTWDEPLARAARAYSAEMADSQRVEHVSSRSGNAADRVRRAGARAQVVLENVARAHSIADAQRSFMSSPGHRANVLSRQVNRLGAGVVLRREPGGVPSFYVTQLFAR